MKSKKLIPLLNLLCPGWGYVYAGNIFYGISWQLILYGIVLLFTLSRLIVSPMSISFLGISLLLATIYSSIRSYISFKEQVTLKHCSTVYFVMFPIVATLLLLLAFINKSIIFGFEIYKINSSSMSPTLLPGDYVVADTWVYKSRLPTLNEIVVFQTNVNNMAIKRVMPIPLHLKHTSNFFYLLGDNASNSMDSRYLGLINCHQIKGKAVYILYAKDINRIKTVL